MSGCSSVDLRSENYFVRAESPIMNFSSQNPPGTEMRWHQNWKQEAAAWLQRAKPILDHRLAMLIAEPDPDWALVRYEDHYPLWMPGTEPKQSLPWRVGFTSMKGPRGMTEVVVAFSKMPTEEARRRFKGELDKDFAMLKPEGRALQ
jgi:hypothetical protein